MPAANSEEIGPNATLAGWSKGYVEYVWNPSKRILTPWASSDGLHWTAGARLDTSPWTADLKSYDAGNDGSDPAFHDACSFALSDFQEGRATLLADGYLDCAGGGCGSSDWTSSPATWISSDGSSWKLTDDPPGYSLSGGSAGFIASSYGDASAASIWTSPDGQTWTKGALPAVALADGSYLGGPVSVAGGFVLPGVIMVKKGHQTSGSGGGCVGIGPTDLSLYVAALWWSPDGTTWTRDSLSGTISSYNGVQMSVTRIDDHTVVAKSVIGNVSTEWASRDGRSWTRLKGNPVDPTLPGSVIVGRTRGLLYEQPSTSDSDANPTICEFGSNFSIVTLKESGDLPWWDSEQFALGPTGLLVTDDGTRFWLGVPTTN